MADTSYAAHTHEQRQQQNGFVSFFSGCERVTRLACDIRGNGGGRGEEQNLQFEKGELVCRLDKKAWQRINKTKIENMLGEQHHQFYDNKKVPLFSERMAISLWVPQYIWSFPN